MTAKSNAPHYVDISFTKRHDMALSKAAQGEPGRARAYVCATRRIEPLEVPISYESWTLRCCVQCSVLAKVTAEHLKEAYLHPERFGRYHKHLYDKVVGSSSVKDKVIIKEKISTR